MHAAQAFPKSASSFTVADSDAESLGLRDSAAAPASDPAKFADSTFESIFANLSGASAGEQSQRVCLGLSCRRAAPPG